MSITCTKEFTIEESTCAFNSDLTQAAFARTATIYNNHTYSVDDCYLLVDGFSKCDPSTNSRILKAIHFTSVKKGAFNPTTGYFYYSDISDNLVVFDPATEAIVAVSPMGATVNSNGFKQMQYVTQRSLIYMFDELRNFGYIDVSIPAFIPLAAFPNRNFYSFEYSPIANAFYISWTDGPFFGIAKFDLDTNAYSEIYTGIISTTAIVWDSLRDLMLMFDVATAAHQVIEFDTASDAIVGSVPLATLYAGAYQATFVPALNKVFLLLSGEPTSALFGYHVSGHTLAASLSDYRYNHLGHINGGNFISWIDNGAPLYTPYYRLIAPT